MMNTRDIAANEGINCRSRYYIRVNLQIFADDSGKTEKATSKKRSDARKKGQVLQSREITAALVLISIFLSLKIFGGFMYNELQTFTKKILTEYPKYNGEFTINVVNKIFTDTFIVFLKTVAPVLAIAVVTGLATNYAQVGFLFTTETLGLKLERLNPINGFKRLFSLQAFVELLKSIIKMTIVAFIAYDYLKGEAVNVFNMMSMEVADIAIYIATISINLAIRLCMAMIFLGILDYVYQWWQYEKNLRMSKHEVKEENKQAEGNPEIKSKVRQKMRQMSMRRMMQEIPKADVVITNPTHFAVAVKYDQNASAAPVVIAKGQDFIAQRIKEVARDNKIEIVENKPLARALYDKVEIGQSIPPELYQAVAEVLAFVYSLKGKNKAV